VSAAIWCSRDRATAWREYLLEGKAPEASTAGCATPVERNVQLGQRLGVQGTPALIFADGTVVPGLISRAQIEARMRAAGEALAKQKGPSK
jgi:thiol:disulfide interchange protein DsbC